MRKRKQLEDSYETKTMSTGHYEDLVKARVVDPKKVTGTALQNTSSIAACC